MSATQRAAVVTGVSTGIGRAAAAALIGAGWRVFGSVRKEKDGADARAALGPHFTALLFDVTDADAIRRSADLVRAELAGRTLGGLVNNAGIGIGGPLAYIPPEEIERQFNVNLLGAVRATQAFLPLLGTDPSLKGPKGRVVNMSSVGGRIAAPFAGPYAMSKHALEAFSESLRRELLLHGVDVVIVGPGVVKTPIWSKGEDFGFERYHQTEYADLLQRMERVMTEVGDKGLPPEAVGDVVVEALTVRRPKTRYAVLKGKFLNWTLPNLLPRRMVDAAIAQRFGIKRRRA